jgi:hypothetical protein
MKEVLSFFSWNLDEVGFYPWPGCDGNANLKISAYVK